MDFKLSLIDYVVIIGFLVISSAIGLYYRFTGGRQKTTEEFFVANRDMGVTTVAIGLMVSYLSAVSVLGVSREIYTFGTHYVVIVIGYILATPFACYLYLPVFFNLEAASAFQYLELRFGAGTRITASIAFLLQNLLYTGVVLYAPALTLQATADVSMTISIIVIGLVCTFYSTLGGIKAVLITDIFQALLMVVSLIIVIVTGIIYAGGVDKILEIAQQGDRIDFYNVSIDPATRHTWWSLIIGGFFIYLSLYGVNQVQVQRLLTVKTLDNAKLAIWATLPITILFVFGMGFSGLAMYSRYSKCDPLTAGIIRKDDQIMPFYIMDNLSKYPGIPGLFVAGIFSAGLSTVSAIQNSIAVIILEDYIKPIRNAKGKSISESTSALISKFLAFIVGLVCIALAYVAHFFDALLQVALTIFGVVGGPFLGVYTLGMFFESSNDIGASVGLITSTALTLWIGFGQPKPPVAKLPVDISGCNSTLSSSLPPIVTDDDKQYFYLYKISYLWYSPIGFILCITIGLFISWLARKVLKLKEQNLSADLFTPIIARRILKQREKTQKLLENNNQLPSNANEDCL